MTEIICIAVTAVMVAAAVTVVILYRIHTMKILRNVNDMLDKAIDGNFNESIFDESMTSQLECKLGEYLSSSEISSRNVAEEKDKIKELIADISHQTKTPTSNIMLYSELLLEQKLPDEARRYADLINNQADKLSFLITSLVKLSRLEAGVFTLNPKKSEIMPMLEKIQMQLAAAAKDKEIELIVEHTDLCAVFDEKWTAEAIFNIAENAVKYTDSGSVKISVKGYEMFICVKITDTGMGISEDEHSKIFSRFYRSSDAAKKDGVGIGLYLSRQIISDENGYIKVSSEKGKGSEFSVFLPVEKEILQN